MRPAICWCGGPARSKRSAATCCRCWRRPHGLTRPPTDQRLRECMKLIRTIRLDPSDTFVFEPAAEPGEWAVSGAFAFWSANGDRLEGKAHSAFRSGFLGVGSLGWSTLVQIVEATAADRAALVERLAQQLVAQFGAPDIAAAGVAA